MNFPSTEMIKIAKEKIRETKNWIVTPSNFNVFMECPTKYVYSQCVGLFSPKESKKLVIGILFHKAKYLKDKFNLDVALQSLERWCYEYFVQASNNNTSFNTDDLEEIGAIVKGALSNYPYAHSYKFLECAALIKADKLLEHSKHSPLFLGLSDKEFYLGGISDLIEFHGKDILISDYKTTDRFYGKMDEAYMNSLLQMALYSMIFGRYLTTVCKVRQIYIKTPSIRHRKNETHEDFVLRLEEEYKKSEYYDVSDMGQPDLFKWDSEISQQLFRIKWTILKFLQGKKIEKRSRSCYMYNKQCMYYDLCWRDQFDAYSKFFSFLGPNVHPEFKGIEIAFGPKIKVEVE